MNIVEKALVKVRSEPEITKEEMEYNEKRAHLLFDGHTIWEAVHR